MGGARLHAGGGLALGEPALAHVALAHDAEALVELRHVVRALQDAVAAADALVVEVAHDAGDRILFIGEHGAAVEARGILAMVARGRDGLRERMAAVGTDELADIAPRLGVVEAVERVAGGDTALAPGAGIEVDLEGILFAGLGAGEGDERGVARLGNVARFVRGGKFRDGRLQVRLLGEELVDQGERRLLFPRCDHVQ